MAKRDSYIKTHVILTLAAARPSPSPPAAPLLETPALEFMRFVGDPLSASLPRLDVLRLDALRCADDP